MKRGAPPSEIPDWVRRRLRSPHWWIVSSFLSLIAVSTVLLALPVAATGGRLSLVDAFFTATSAACVTGLIVVDTGTDLSLFGQLVVLSEIQLGGLGIMTFSALFIYLAAGRLTMRGRLVLRETFSYGSARDVARLLRFVFVSTILFEAAGFLALAIGFGLREGFGAATLYSALFHSVSAFCNAGFSIHSDSLVGYAGAPMINLAFMFLIVAGGLGFWTLLEVREMLLRGRGRVSLTTRMVVVTTAALIVFGAVGFAALEAGGVLSGTGVGGGALRALFQSVTARTAGFNTVDLARASEATLLLVMALMVVGGSPGSTAGGVKTTALAVFLAVLVARYRGRSEVRIARRAVPAAVVSRVLGLVALYLGFLALLVFVLTVLERGSLAHGALASHHFLDLAFEATSAVGTVGLSTGVTPLLSPLSKLALAAGMLVGRVGPLTVMLLISHAGREPRHRLPEEGVVVG